MRYLTPTFSASFGLPLTGAPCHLLSSRSRIEELESEVAQLRSTPVAGPIPAASPAARVPAPSTSGPAAPAAPAAAPATATITLIYETGWANAYLHYSADKKSWTKARTVRGGAPPFSRTAGIL